MYTIPFKINVYHSLQNYCADITFLSKLMYTIPFPSKLMYTIPFKINVHHSLQN